MDIITQQFVKPFGKELKKGRERALKSFSKKAGVYFIKEDGVIVYVGMSTHCVVKACYRHFYPWRDCYRGMGREYRTTYYDLLQVHDYEIHIIATIKTQAADLEKAFIISLNPRDNREKYEYYFKSMVDEALTKGGYIHKDEAPIVGLQEDGEDDLPF